MAGQDDKVVGNAPTLSVLIATVVGRAERFNKLHAELARQAEGHPVEILHLCDNKEISVGLKRQRLLEMATGEYVCFVDDDDWIAANYVESILRALGHKPDCVGFEIRCTTNGANIKRAVASMRYKDWCENRDGYAFCRSPYHKVPIKRSIALKVGFPDLRYAEDRVYSKGVTALIKTEIFVPEQLYLYRFSTEENFFSKYGIKKKPKTDYKGRKIG